MSYLSDLISMYVPITQHTALVVSSHCFEPIMPASNSRTLHLLFPLPRMLSSPLPYPKVFTKLHSFMKSYIRLKFTFSTSPSLTHMYHLRYFQQQVTKKTQPEIVKTKLHTTYSTREGYFCGWISHWHWDFIKDLGPFQLSTLRLQDAKNTPFGITSSIHHEDTIVFTEEDRHFSLCSSDEQEKSILEASQLPTL